MTENNNQALTIRPNEAELTGRQVDLSGTEQALVAGNLASISPEQRMTLYLRACQSIGLNPLTKPFEYLTLNNRMILYPTKAAAEQLRQIHNVSVVIMNRQRDSDLYIVTALATLPNGRRDTATGIVPIGGMKGTDLANAMMKAETKAKRRVTLSICGLSWLDEIDPDVAATAHRTPVEDFDGEWAEETESPFEHDQPLADVDGVVIGAVNGTPVQSAGNREHVSGLFEPDPEPPAQPQPETADQRAAENRARLNAAGGPVNVNEPNGLPLATVCECGREVKPSDFANAPKHIQDYGSEHPVCLSCAGRKAPKAAAR